ncbi:MAG TPA: sugar ABC transporter permease [Chthoniobacterales bacterium]|nr:sugar ABC transporter permease [Chthoniobacterales bacterium]
MPSEKTKVRLFLAALLTPAPLVVLAVLAFPFLFNVILSFSNSNIYHIRDWRLIGFDQFVSVFRQELFWSILAKTVIWTLVNIVFHVVIGVFLAVVLHQKFIRGRGWWRVTLILPSGAAAVHHCAHLARHVQLRIRRREFAHHEIPALAAGRVAHLAFEAFLAVIITNVWLGFPFTMVIALGGLQSIPRRSLRSS